jgi:hypothetical protein
VSSAWVQRRRDQARDSSKSNPRRVDVGAAERAGDHQLAADPLVRQRTHPWLTGLRAGRGQQQQVRTLERPADLAAVGAELVDDPLVEALELVEVGLFAYWCTIRVSVIFAVGLPVHHPVCR